MVCKSEVFCAIFCFAEPDAGAANRGMLLSLSRTLRPTV